MFYMPPDQFRIKVKTILGVVSLIVLRMLF